MASVQLLASTVKGPVIIQGWDDKLQGFLVGEPRPRKACSSSSQQLCEIDSLMCTVRSTELTEE
jgi:hypothetical protein